MELENEKARSLLRKHTVTFKCIEPMHDSNAQVALHKVSDLMGRGKLVSVKLHCEPDNQCEANTISFTCNIEGKWCQIGYIVQEALDHVHTALANKRSCT